MGKLLNIITPLHRSTRRDYLGRMSDDKIACMEKAREYEFDYWDGDRRHGYGGYRYLPGRWLPVALALKQTYNLKAGSKILDVGCGKGFLLYELTQAVPGIEVCGLDISEHALATAKDEIRPHLFKHRAEEPLPFRDQEFDLVLSLNALHNLRIFDLKKALSEIQRVGKNAYTVVESYRNPRELFNLQCWALTAESFFDEEEWVWIFNSFNYRGDYEFIYFE